MVGRITSRFRHYKEYQNCIFDVVEQIYDTNSIFWNDIDICTTKSNNVTKLLCIPYKTLNQNNVCSLLLMFYTDVKNFQTNVQFLYICTKFQYKCRKKFYRQCLDVSTLTAQQSAYFIEFYPPCKWSTFCIHVFAQVNFESC